MGIREAKMCYLPSFLVLFSCHNLLWLLVVLMDSTPATKVCFSCDCQNSVGATLATGRALNGVRPHHAMTLGQ